MLTTFCDRPEDSTGRVKRQFYVTVVETDSGYMLLIVHSTVISEGVFLSTF